MQNKNSKPTLKFSTVIIGIAILTLLLVLTTSASAKSKPKPLCTCWYSYRELVRKGYKPVKFKGRQFITFEKYQQLLAATKPK